ncbi:hypothetical protein [Pseudomonas tolaasii]|uniref:hypothetical protein n=1 Tax=Pseudomonas tolaasii TaxID=29442 RepID=UPI0018E0D7FC|nr:hypothetical protein [Pseudomonas tolaasii]
MNTPASTQSPLVSLGVADAARAILTGEITAEAYASALLQQSRNSADLNTFIRIDEAAVLASAREADARGSRFDPATAGRTDWGERQLPDQRPGHQPRPGTPG